MRDVLKIDRMSLRDLSLRDERSRKSLVLDQNNSQKSITLSNSRPLYMVNKNILLFYFIKIFYVSKLAIKKCPSVTSRRDTFGQRLKLTVFRKTLDTWLKYIVF